MSRPQATGLARAYKQSEVHRARIWVPAAFALLAIAVLSIGLVGCSATPGPTQQLTVNEPLGGAAVTDVQLKMGAGKLTLQPGGAGLVQGVIRYNIPSWKPSVKRTDSQLIIDQGNPGAGGLLGKVVNDWTLQLGKAPMTLRIDAGAYEGSMDLSGLTLRTLTIKDGASKTQVKFNTPNPGQMDNLTYTTGASTVTLSGLANANFQQMKFEGGAGSYTLDFSGNLRTDATVTIKAGVGSMQIDVPPGTASQVNLSGTLTKVSTQGAWTTVGSSYSTTGSGKSLTINVSMSVGTLKLVSQ